MSRTNAVILLFILAVGIGFGSYWYVMKPNIEEKQDIESDIDTLEAKLADLRQKEQNRETYLRETDEYNAAFEEIVAYFPANYDQEVSVMFIKGCEDARDGEFEISSTGLGQPSQFYSLGASAATDEDGNAVSSGGYVCYEAAFPISYTGTYDSIKDFIDYIDNYKYRMNISSFSIAYDAENDVATGSVLLNTYYVMGEGRTPDTVDVDVQTGVDNIFIGGEGAPSNTSNANDADNGASIKTNYDVMMLLNNAGNDTADGIIVAAGGDNTNVTSGENSVETVELTVYEEDGKNYVTYAIGDEDYTVEVTSDSVKIYVKSSERTDSDDKNGVKVNIDNQTKLPVYFKVEDDDATSPRFKLGSKSGTVKVY